MKRFALVLLAVMALVVAAQPASAQNIRWGVGAGLLMPMGTYADFDKMGYTAGLGGTYNLPSGVGIRADLSYGTSSEKSGVGAHSTKIMGGMASMLWWPEEFCRELAGHRRYVIRYDQRDTGHSTKYPPGNPGYTLDDFAKDAIDVLDGYGIASAHIIGMSLGGMIAQLAAVGYPSRVRSLTTISHR